MAQFHRFSMFNQNQSISNLVIFEQNTKAIANMEVTARVLFTLAMVYFVLQWSVTENIRNDGSGFNIVTVRCGSKFGRRYPSGKAWRKFILSKFHRKRCCRRPTGLVTSAIVVSSTEMEPFLSLLLSGDVELNPGPTNSSKSSRSANKEGNLDFGEILLRLEEKFDSGQESILRNQTQIMNRLSSLESQMEKFKEEIDDLRTQTTNLKSTINSLSESVGNNYDHGKDLQFLVDRQEQYSRKNSIRITGVTEETGESIENKTISILKNEIDVDISSEEIEIVHRVGRVHNGNPRSILVKFLSHKTKESVMRRKKNDYIQDFSVRCTLARLRLSAHNLQVETGRFNKTKTPRDQRFCLYCKTLNIFIVEDEIHFLLVCSLFNEERQRFLEEIHKKFPATVLLNDRNMFLWLMSQEDYIITKRIGMFCKTSFTKRSKFLSNPKSTY